MKRTSSYLIAFILGGASASAEPITFAEFDTNHSTIGFEVPILGGLSHVEGKFTNFSVTVIYDPDEPSNSSVEAVIPVTSIETGIDDRDGHLMSPDFFDAANHSEIRFKSSNVEEKDGQLLAHGELTMRGVTKSLTLPFQITGLHEDPESGGSILGLATETTLDRQDFGISWQHDMPLFVGDEIQVKIQLISRLTKPE